MIKLAKFWSLIYVAHIRFFFFFPAPGSPLGPSCDINALDDSCGIGAGVADERIVVVTGVSGSFSAGCATDDAVNDILECAAVVLIAFRSSMLFFCLLGASVRFSGGTWGSPVASISVDSASALFLLVSSDSVGSVIGQMNPVRGV